MKSFTITLLLTCVSLVLLTSANPISPAAIPGHNGGEGAKRSELVDSVILERGGGAGAHHGCVKKKQCPDGTKAYWNTKAQKCLCPPSGVPGVGGGEGPQVKDRDVPIPVSERDTRDIIETRQISSYPHERSVEMPELVQIRSVCHALKCQNGFHGSYVDGQKVCRCVIDRRLAQGGPKERDMEVVELEKRKLKCAKGYHAVYVDGKGDLRCEPVSVRGGH